MIGILGWIFRRVLFLAIISGALAITFPDAASKVVKNPQVVSWLYSANDFVSTAITSITDQSTSTSKSATTPTTANPKVSTIVGTLASGSADTVKALKPVATSAATITADPGPWLSLAAVVIAILILVTAGGRRWAGARVSGVAKGAGTTASKAISFARSRTDEAIIAIGVIAVIGAFWGAIGGNIKNADLGAKAILPGFICAVLVLSGLVLPKGLLKVVCFLVGGLGLLAIVVASGYSTPQAFRAAMASYYPQSTDLGDSLKNYSAARFADLAALIMLMGKITAWTVVSAIGWLMFVVGVVYGVIKGSSGGRQGNPGQPVQT